MTDDKTRTAESPFPVETVLRDGTPVLVRPIRPDDKHLLEVGLEHLSTRIPQMS